MLGLALLFALTFPGGFASLGSCPWCKENRKKEVVVEQDPHIGVFRLQQGEVRAAQQGAGQSRHWQVEKVVWDKGGCDVREVVQEVSQNRRPSDVCSDSPSPGQWIRLSGTCEKNVFFANPCGLFEPTKDPAAKNKKPDELVFAQRQYTREEGHLMVTMAYSAFCGLKVDQNMDCFWCKKIRGMLKDFAFVSHFGGVESATRGYIAWSTSQKTLYVVWAGTANAPGIFADADMKPVPYQYRVDKAPLNGITAYSGFQNAHLSGEQEVRVLVRKVLSERCPNDDCTVYVVGHSLGGGIALLSAASLARTFMEDGKRIPIDVYAMGSPRMGNAAWAEYYSKDLSFPKGVIRQTFRVVNFCDVVTAAPPRTLKLAGKTLWESYTHVAREYWLGDGEKQSAESADKVRVCDASGEDPKCSASCKLWSWAHHESYHGIMLGDGRLHQCLWTDPKNGVVGAIFETIATVKEAIEKKKKQDSAAAVPS